MDEFPQQPRLVESIVVVAQRALLFGLMISDQNAGDTGIAAANCVLVGAVGVGEFGRGFS